jgi:hypothetical protein
MATRNFVPRKSGEGSIGTKKKHWGSAFFEKVAVKTLEVIDGGTENDAQPATIGWAKSKAQELVKSAFASFGVRYIMSENGYLCLGSLFGNIKIQWGFIDGRSVTNVDQSTKITLPIAIQQEYFSCGNVNIAGGNADHRWKTTPPVVSTIFSGGQLYVASNYFGSGYGTRWFVIGF